MPRSLYIATTIAAGPETVWRRTRDPGQHQRWDLRFTSITGLDGGDDGAQHFCYATRLLPGLTIAGTGTTAAERTRADGVRTSALRFGSAHPLSPIAEGAGHWRYTPVPGGVDFATGYHYRPRWGRAGRVADAWVVAPLMGWATAWSFDRLRLWCERGTAPERLRNLALAEAAARVAVVAAAAPALPAWMLPVVAVAAVALPPAPGVPAARRCRRRPGASAAAPAVPAAAGVGGE
ncbi:SRPBCC family protein [Streptomonospora sediminis]